MGSEKPAATRTAEIKRLVARGQYEVDPRVVAEAMIRRGQWTLELWPWRGLSDRRSQPTWLDEGDCDDRLN